MRQRAQRGVGAHIEPRGVDIEIVSGLTGERWVHIRQSKHHRWSLDEWVHIRQSKHHRWSLDESQIYQYHLECSKRH
jgi:hypothetical protein